MGNQSVRSLLAVPLKNKTQDSTAPSPEAGSLLHPGEHRFPQVWDFLGPRQDPAVSHSAAKVLLRAEGHWWLGPTGPHHHQGHHAWHPPSQLCLTGSSFDSWQWPNPFCLYRGHFAVSIGPSEAFSRSPLQRTKTSLRLVLTIGRAAFRPARTVQYLPGDPCVVGTPP